MTPSPSRIRTYSASTADAISRESSLPRTLSDPANPSRSYKSRNRPHQTSEEPLPSNIPPTRSLPLSLNNSTQKSPLPGSSEYSPLRKHFTSRTRSGSISMNDPTSDVAMATGAQLTPISYEQLITVAVVGSSGCGKTNIIKRGCKAHAMAEPMIGTPAADGRGQFRYTSRLGKINQDPNMAGSLRVLEADLSDLHLDNPLSKVWPDFAPRVDCVIVCYDSSSLTSFTHVERLVCGYNDMKLPTVVVACKSDAVSEVDPHTTAALLRGHEVGLVEVSMFSDAGKAKARRCFDWVIRAVHWGRCELSPSPISVYRNPAFVGVQDASDHPEGTGLDVRPKKTRASCKGWIVGSGSTPPIMVTDVPKSVHKSQPLSRPLVPSTPALGCGGSPVDSPRRPLQNPEILSHIPSLLKVKFPSGSRTLAETTGRNSPLEADPVQMFKTTFKFAKLLEDGRRLENLSWRLTFPNAVRHLSDTGRSDDQIRSLSPICNGGVILHTTVAPGDVQGTFVEETVTTLKPNSPILVGMRVVRPIVDVEVLDPPGISPYWRGRRISGGGIVHSPESGIDSRVPPVPPLPANLSSTLSHTRHVSTEVPRKIPPRSKSLRADRLSSRASKTRPLSPQDIDVGVEIPQSPYRFPRRGSWRERYNSGLMDKTSENARGTRLTRSLPRKGGSRSGSISEGHQSPEDDGESKKKVDWYDV